VKKLPIVLLLLGALSAAGVWWQRHRQEQSARHVAYTVLPVEYGKLVETVSAPGVVQPRQLHAVGTEAIGQIIDVAADFNDEVSEGQVLFRVDDRLLRHQRDQAKSAVDAAVIIVEQAVASRDTEKKLLEREETRPVELRRDIEIHILTNRLRAAEAAVNAAENKVTQARLALDLAELTLRKTVVRVPSFHSSEDRPAVGTLSEEPTSVPRKFLVLDRRATLGQLVGGATAAHLFTLAAGLDTVQVEAQVAEGDVGKVTKALDAEITVASQGEDRVFRGKVTDVRPLPVSDHGAVFYKVIIEARNEHDPATGRWRLTPGLTATVDIVRRQHDRAWKMPTMALSFQPEEARLSEATRGRLRRWHDLTERENWKVVWTVGDDKTLSPIFVRVGGSAAGETGIHDLSFTEVLEWDAELKQKPEPGRPGTYPQVIIAAPPTKAGGFSLKF